MVSTTFLGNGINLVAGENYVKGEYLDVDQTGGNFRIVTFTITTYAANFNITIRGLTYEGVTVEETVAITSNNTFPTINKYNKIYSIVPSASSSAASIGNGEGTSAEVLTCGAKTSHLVLGTESGADWTIQCAISNGTKVGTTPPVFVPVQSSLKDQIGALQYPVYVEIPVGKYRFSVNAFNTTGDYVWYVGQQMFA